MILSILTPALPPCQWHCYSTFRWDVTDFLAEENRLTVHVDNSRNDRVYPQKADFTFYGGIYRDVLVLVVGQPDGVGPHLPDQRHVPLMVFTGQGAAGALPVLVAADAVEGIAVAFSGERAGDSELQPSLHRGVGRVQRDHHLHQGR